MAIATISFIPQNFEWILWLFIFGFCAYSIAKHCDSRYFFHGFMLSIINCIYITAFHAAFWDRYYAAHSDFISGLPQGVSPRAMVAAFGLVAGVVSGLVQGGLAFGAAKLQKKA